MSDSFEEDGGSEELIGLFVQEAQEHLEAIEPALLALEEDGDGAGSDMTNLIFRAVHSIKGGAGFLALTKVASLSHAIENMMSLVRDGSLSPTQQVVDALLGGIDKVRSMIEDVGSSEEAHIEAEVAAIDEALGRTGGTSAGGGDLSGDKVGSSGGDGGSVRVEECIDYSACTQAIEAAKTAGEFLFTINFKAGEKVKPLSIAGELEALGTIVAAAPKREDLEKVEDGGEVTMLYSTALDGDMLLGLVPLEPDNIKAFEGGGGGGDSDAGGAKAEAPPVKKSENKRGPSKVKAAQETVRINVTLLDKLMDLAGEIVLGRNQILSQFDNEKGANLLTSHSKLVTELQESILKTRLQPVGPTFTKFKRVVRDISKSVGKEINLVTEGEDVELDRSIIDGLSDPLTHIIRNSADHGLESPEERLAAGKGKAGTIYLRVFHEGGHVVIVAEDDGRGIDAEKVKGKALERGIITHEMGERLNDKDTVRLIFAPGFTTVDEVSQISGRGVGMDVVKSSFEKLGGTVDVSSEAGKGTRLTIRLPLTLAIISTLIVGSEKYRFAIPQVDMLGVIRIMEGDKEKIEVIQGHEVLRLRGRLIPVLRLAEVLNIKRTYKDPLTGEVSEDKRSNIADRRDSLDSVTDAVTDAATDLPQGKEVARGEERRSVPEVQRIVIVTTGSNTYGLLVDNIYDAEEVVVKPLPILIKSYRPCSGATIMGDGTVAMILNIGEIAVMSGFKFGALEDRCAALEASSHRESEEREIIIVFKVAETEFFALPISAVARIERIRGGDIERVGTNEYTEIRGRSISLLRLENYMNVTPAEMTAETYFVIVPKGTDKSVGIISSGIVDVLDTKVELSDISDSEEGLKGTFILKNRTTSMLDMGGIMARTGLA